ncbi:MAG: hypothetical protein JWO94_2255, partial [Verrucomicrobiaceae bacterium]|nr:hypothetical protein [Verrucomicrobiaceae bacterium]
MNTFVTSFAVLAALIATTQAQTAVATATSSVSRLSQMALDAIPEASAVDVTSVAATIPGSRLGGMLLAQIPIQQRPTMHNGQNPNTIPPGANRPGFGTAGGVNPATNGNGNGRPGGPPIGGG